MMLGAVLAGGGSTRMGRDKAVVEVAGRTMLDRVAVAVGAVVDRVVVAGHESLPGIDRLPDPIAGRAGPLAGVAAALAEADGSGAQSVLAVAVDHPFVRPSTLARLLELGGTEAVIPVADGVRQVTCAVYPAAWHAEALAELRAGGSIQSLLDRMPHRLVTPEEWTQWGEDGASWFSVDDPGTLAAGVDRFGSVLE